MVETTNDGRGIRARWLEELEPPTEHPAAMGKALELAERLQQRRDR
jgi:hypothetical protein